MADLLRQAVYSRLAGYEDVNDAQRLSQDRPSDSWVRNESGSVELRDIRLQSFETELLTKQRTSLAWPQSTGADCRAETIESPQRVVLDMDSTEIPATGSRNERLQQILRIDLLSPAVAVQRRGRRLTAKLRPGNVHSAEDWENCYYRRSSTSKNSARKWCFAPMLPLPSRRFTMLWRREV